MLNRTFLIEQTFIAMPVFLSNLNALTTNKCAKVLWSMTWKNMLFYLSLGVPNAYCVMELLFFFDRAKRHPFLSFVTLSSLAWPAKYECLLPDCSEIWGTTMVYLPLYLVTTIKILNNFPSPILVALLKCSVFFISNMHFTCPVWLQLKLTPLQQARY